MYRALQVHHSIATQAAGPLLPIVIPVGEAILVATSFCVLRFHDSLKYGIMLMFALIGLLAFIMLKLAIQLAVRVTSCSQQLQQLSETDSVKRQFSKSDIKFFKSCNPLKWNIGGSFTLNSSTFNRIMNDVVISWIINLLIAY